MSAGRARINVVFLSHGIKNQSRLLILTDFICHHRFLGQLPDPLLMSSLHDSWLSLMGESSSPTPRRLKSVKDLVRQLPPVNAATLKALLTHFWMIDQVNEFNCMVSDDAGYALWFRILRIAKNPDVTFLRRKYWATRSFVHSHCSFILQIRLLPPLCILCSRALLRSFVRSPTYLLLSSRERGFCP